MNADRDRYVYGYNKGVCLNWSDEYYYEKLQLYQLEIIDRKQIRNIRILDMYSSQIITILNRILL